MKYSDFYQSYKGPKLIQATINNKDITKRIQQFYGKDNNWNGMLWTYKDIFPDNTTNCEFYCLFQSDDKREHWRKGNIGKKNQYFNLPLSMPYNQINI